MSFDKYVWVWSAYMSRSVLGSREMVKAGPLLGLNHSTSETFILVGVLARAAGLFGFSVMRRGQLFHTHRAKEGDTMLQKV